MKKIASNAKNTRVVGIDPGFTDVVTGRYDDISFHYSSGQYYDRAKINYSRYIINKLNEDEKNKTDSTSIKRSRTAFDDLSEWIRNYLEVFKSLLEDRLLKSYRKLRFLRFVRKKRIVNEICDMIAPPDIENVLVGFGDWSGGHISPVSRKAAGPIQEIKRVLKSRKNVWFKHIDEYNTSKICSSSNRLLKNMKANTVKKLQNGEKITTSGKVHKVLHCVNIERENTKIVKKLQKGQKITTSKKFYKALHCINSERGRTVTVPQSHGTTWNRDVNASINILNLFTYELLGEQRPQRFCRSKGTKKHTM
jgi:transposase